MAKSINNSTPTESLTDPQLLRLVDRLAGSHRKAVINFFVGRKVGLSTSDLIKAARFRKETSELTTVATKPWDRRPDESAKAYEAFVIYRDLGADRTYTEVCAQLNKGHTTIALWKRQFQWPARVRAYDEWQEKSARRLIERQKKEMVERQARLGQTMTGKAQDALDSGVIVPETVADVVRLAEAGTRIERLARGESTENVVQAQALILAHPLPAWAPEAARQLVTENEFEAEDQDGQGNDITTRTKAEAGTD